MEELLGGHEARIRDNLGVSKESFGYLLDLLARKTIFAATRHMDTKEQLGIFFMLL